MKGNLLFFDIDGTLAIGRHIPEENRNALKQLNAQKNYTFICTGRAPFYAREMFSDLTTGIVSCNGRFISMDGQKLQAWPLREKEIQKIRDLADRHEIEVLFAGEEKSYPYNMRQATLDACARMYGAARIAEADETMKDVYTFDLFYAPERIAEIEQVFQDFAVLNPHGQHGSADCSTLCFDKGSAAAWLKQHLQMEDQQVYAFGDGTNDLAMFREAGHAIAMANGEDSVKAAAEYMTDAVDQSGIVNALKHYHFIV